ncbi:uncharacterized protein LOC120352300 [Nilaparvata lugens]|uniref:uncharacterized protein LOC120352300 n=1 Tax=Nilaparvata lugens TaxID=108931 RepID=UPI00193CB4DB|nr:uncharacterized protein LOC120352300 [Nilaparvata lugens]
MQSSLQWKLYDAISFTHLEAYAEHLQSATSWFLANRFQLNEDKTQRIICSLSREPRDPQNPVKLLGFVLDSKLSWNSHIQQVTSRLSRICFLLLKMRGLVTEKYLIMMYHALFHCHITYGLLLWGHSAGAADVLRLQKRAIRIITGSDHLAHCKPIFARLGVLSVFSHYILLCLVYVKKIQHTLAARSDIHRHNTRRSELLDIPRRRLHRSQASYRISALKFYNKLPNSVKQLDEAAFRRTVRKLLCAKAYYSVNEFMGDNLNFY